MLLVPRRHDHLILQQSVNLHDIALLEASLVILWRVLHQSLMMIYQASSLLLALSPRVAAFIILVVARDGSSPTLCGNSGDFAFRKFFNIRDYILRQLL